MSNKLSGRSRSVGRMWRERHPCKPIEGKPMIETILSWGQRKEPEVGTKIYFNEDVGWSEHLDKETTKSGTYLGNMKVEIDNDTSR